MDKSEAIKKAHEMYVYEESEQADQESGLFDDLWQSIYDVCQIASFGIIDTVEEDELQEAIEWLKETKSLTEHYKDLEINF
jgi:hypothetical protein